jgi:hypothetical protein
MAERYRYLPLTLLKRKSDGKKFLVQFDYTYAHGAWNDGCNFGDLSLYELDEEENIINCSAWHNVDDFEFLELPKVEYIEKVTKYNIKLYGKPLL